MAIDSCPISATIASGPLARGSIRQATTVIRTPAAAVIGASAVNSGIRSNAIAQVAQLATPRIRISLGETVHLYSRAPVIAANPIAKNVPPIAAPGASASTEMETSDDK